MKFIAITCTTALLATTMSAGAMATLITTEFNTNNSQDGNAFNITASNALTIQGISQNFYSQGSFAAGSYAVYEDIGGFTGSPSSGKWVLVDTANAFTTSIQNTPTVLTFATPLAISLTAGETVGLYLTFTNTTNKVAYTNGTNVGDVAATNADLTIYQGFGETWNLAMDYSPRIWNGTLNYTLNAAPTYNLSPIPEPASFAGFGAGLLVLAMIRRRKST
jgi:hypothetical protein